MGLRFRKSVKIAPGVRVNFNKKSTSVSFGGKGVRHTISSTGRRTSSVGIPGSGLYYTKSSSAKKSRNRKNNTYTTNNEYTYEDPYYEVEQFNSFIETITSFHKNCDYSMDWDKIRKEPPPFNLEKKGPNEIEALESLNNYKPNLIEKIFKNVNKKKIDKLKNNLELSKTKDMELYRNWEKQNIQAQSILEGNLTTYTNILNDMDFLNNLSEFVPKFDFQFSNKDEMIIEYNLNIDNVVPEKYATLTKTGKLSIRKYTKTDYYEIIQQYVSSLAIRIARNIFGLLPIKTVIINTKNNILDTSIGEIKNITILSVKIDRNTLNGLNFDLINPFDAMSNFEHNVRFLKTKGFQPVEKINI